VIYSIDIELSDAEIRLLLQFIGRKDLQIQGYSFLDKMDLAYGLCDKGILMKESMINTYTPTNIGKTLLEKFTRNGKLKNLLHGV
jgi:hypothetical protein